MAPREVRHRGTPPARRIGTRSGGAADGAPPLAQAEETAATAAGRMATDASRASILAHDAPPFACASLLAQQGMRATTSGGHYAVERAVRAQFGPGFRPFGDLRRRRNESEYPRLPADTASEDEAAQATEIARQLITATKALLGQMSFFAQQ